MEAVWGQMTIGGGATHLNESLAAMNVPGMNTTSFSLIEAQIGEMLKKELHTQMLEAGREERRQAVEHGDFHQGVPAIAVIGNCGWSKHSYKHSYSANSAVGVIIGARTGKLLGIGVRNRYCAVCERAKGTGKKAQGHRCYKNWEGSAAAMESDIIVDLFKQAETVHGLRYMWYIGDGDSSTYPSIVTQVPGWGMYVEKIECANHACKVYRGHLESLVKENPKYGGRGRLTKHQRSRITSGARCAIKMHSATKDINQLKHDILNGPYHVFGFHAHCNPQFCNVAKQRQHPNMESQEECNLQTGEEDEADTLMEVTEQQQETTSNDAMDPLNSLDAYISHLNREVIDEDLTEEAMQQSTCSPLTYTDPVMTPEIEELLQQLMKITSKLAENAHKLIYNYTSNRAECYMAIRAKMDGGKRVNRIQSGSFEARCYAAGLRQVSGPSWSFSTWKSCTGSSAGDVHKQYAGGIKRKHEHSMKRKVTHEAKRARRERKQGHHADHTKEAEIAYGPICQQFNISVEDLKAKCQQLKEDQNVTTEEAQEIERRTRQQSADGGLWLKLRRSRLTASHFGSIAKRRASTPVGNKVKVLLYSTFQGSKATRYGLAEEENTIDEYVTIQQQNGHHGLSTSKCGLVIDQKEGWLACSPGAMVTDPSSENTDGLAELKNIYKAKDMTIEEACSKFVKDSTFCLVQLKTGRIQLKRRHSFYYQVQGQMAITKRKWCDIVVRTGSNMLHIERITFDQDFWLNFKVQLEMFYDNAVLPEQADPQFPKGRPILNLSKL